MYIVGFGKRDVDVFVFYLILFVWVEYFKFDDSVDKLDILFDKMVKEFIVNKIDFYFGDEIILLKYV